MLECVLVLQALSKCVPYEMLLRISSQMMSMNIEKLVMIVEDESVVSLCGACREYMMQLSKDSSEIETLTDYGSRKAIRLKGLIPVWRETSWYN